MNVPVVAHIPILILGNKIDRPNAISENELFNALDLHSRMPNEVFICAT